MADHDDLETRIDGEVPTLEQRAAPTEKMGAGANAEPPKPGKSRLPDVGEMFAEKYKLVEVVGQGAFARVYRAIQVGIDRTVAIKLLLPHSELHEAVAARFWREAKVLSRLKNPHTVTLYDFGELADGVLYMVFEFVAGMTLADLLATESQLEPDDAHTVLDELLGSLAEAHAEGILHRDIKPGNIMVGREGERLRTTLVDFGIAKSFADDAELSATAEGSVIGTPRYMAPEALRGETPGPPSDLFSLGAVAYEMLVGEPMLKSKLDVLRATEIAEPVSLPAEANATPQLRRFVSACLRPDPRDRPADADAALAILHADSPVAKLERASRPPLLLPLGLFGLVTIAVVVWFASAPHEGRPSPVVSAEPRDVGVQEVDVTSAAEPAEADIVLLVGEVKSFGDFSPSKVTVTDARVAGWTDLGNRAVLSGKRPGRATVTVEEGDEVHEFTVAVRHPTEEDATEGRQRLTLFGGTSLEFPTTDIRRIAVGEHGILKVTHAKERGVFVVTGEQLGTTTLSLLTEDSEDTFVVTVAPSPKTLFQGVDAGRD